MLTVPQALQAVLSVVTRMPAVRVPLADALGCTAAEPVACDLDMPPWDKSIVDGYAVRAADAPGPDVRLAVVGQVPAGRMPDCSVGPGQAVKIMTGAPVPPGADAVVMVEKTRAVADPDGDAVELSGPLKPGQNIAPRGLDVRAGTVVVPAGAVLTAARIGALAAAGAAQPLVFARPRVAVLATGDEIVEVSARPTGAQIRNSNSHSLAAQVRTAGCPVEVFPPAADEAAAFRAAAAEALSRSEVLILSGGVSMGDYDLVPGVLAEMGVTIRAHKVAVKPGKPFLLGTAPGGKLVFGLPGNPVSTFVCFELFVRPALRAMTGHPQPVTPEVSAATLTALAANGDRQTYLPAALVREGGGLRVRKLDGKGSADLFTLAEADALIVRPINAPAAAEGDMVPVLPIPG